MVKFSAGGEGQAKERLKAMVKGHAYWSHTVRAFAGSSPGVLSEQFPVRGGIPRLATLAPDAPRPINVYTD